MHHAWVSGLFTSGDGHAEPGKASMAFAAAAKKHGVIFKEKTPVKLLQKSARDIVSVVTADGVFQVKDVIVAAGVGSVS